MAGNKYDTPFEKLKVSEVTLEYTGLYGDPVFFTGTPEQAIRHLLKLQ